MATNRIDSIRKLLKGIETGDPAAVSVIDPVQYIQHNPQTQTGREGLAALFARLSNTSPRVNIVRAFEDRGFVFAHTEYDFDTRRIGFEVFRFEGDLAVEHWDNIQPREGPNPSGHSMVDGPTEVSDLDRTEANRTLVREFVEQVLIGGDLDALPEYIDAQTFIEHHPTGRDGVENLRERMERSAADPQGANHRWLHRVLAQGDFALAVIEGERSGTQIACYSLFRLEEGKIVEHWDTIEAVAPPEDWMHQNGKF